MIELAEAAGVGVLLSVLLALVLTVIIKLKDRVPDAQADEWLELNRQRKLVNDRRLRDAHIHAMEIECGIVPPDPEPMAVGMAPWIRSKNSMSYLQPVPLRPQRYGAQLPWIDHVNGFPKIIEQQRP